MDLCLVILFDLSRSARPKKVVPSSVFEYGFRARVCL